MEQTTRWSDTMYDMPIEEVREYLKQNSESDIFYIEYNYRDLRETEEWFETQARKIGNPITVKREILLMRIRGSDNSPFDQDALEYIHGKIRPIKSELILQTYYKIDIYENLDRSIPYIIGTDCSTGTNKDHNAFTVINPYTVEPVAEFQCNYIGETKYLALIEEFITKHIPRAILCIERNSVGDAIIDNIIENNRPILTNLYYDRAKDLVTKNINANTTVESMLKARAEEKSYYGVYTSGPSREAMMAILANRVSEHKNKFVTRHITSDLLKLVVSSSGKIQARSGHTDDNIMSYLIGLYVFYHGNNLPLFGFIRGSNAIEEANNSGLDRSVSDYDSDLLPEDVRQAMIREEEYNNEISDDEMTRLLMEAQRQTRALAEKGLIKNDPYRGLPDEYRGNNDPIMNDLSVDFLDELNDW